MIHNTPARSRMGILPTYEYRRTASVQRDLIRSGFSTIYAARPAHGDNRAKNARCLAGCRRPDRLPKEIKALRQGLKPNRPRPRCQAGRGRRMAAGRGSTTTHFGRAAIATAAVALCLGDALLPSPGQAQVPSTVTQTIGGALGGASHGGGTGGGLGGAVGGSTSGSSLGGGVSLGGNGRIMVRGGGSAGNGSNLYGSAGNT